MFPFRTSVTRQPWWVQTAVNALNVPACGWVTTTRLWSNTVPPPTGMSRSGRGRPRPRHPRARVVGPRPGRRCRGPVWVTAGVTGAAGAFWS